MLNAVVAGAPKSDALLPQAPGGTAPGAVLALLVHAGLIAALTLGVDWRNRAPDVVSAELWAAVPQIAAPAAPTAPEPVPAPAPAPLPAPAPPPKPAPEPARAEPPPPQPDIALEQERRRKLERDRQQAEAEKLKAEKAEKAEAEKLKAEKADKAAEKKREADKAARDKADDERLARQREENLRRITGQAGGTTGQATTQGSATQSAAPSASYAGKVKAAVRPNIVYTGSTAGNTAAEVEVSAAPGGTIVSRRLVRSSGNKEWDEAVLRAIDKTPAMPRDTDGRVPSSLLISFRPSE